MFAHNSTTKSRRNTKIGRKVVRITADIPHQFQDQRTKVKVIRPLKAETENQLYLHKGKAYELQTWFKDGVR